MAEQEVSFLTIAELSRLIKGKKLSPQELVRATLDRIQRLDRKLGAYITVMGDEALAAAREAEKDILQGNYRGPLHGIPISLKDLFDTRGVLTTAGSRILADYRPREDATVVARLRQAGAIIIGKANMHEFALGASNDNPHYGTARNPWAAERIPGGSSGGSAVAVAASLCSGSLGSDTGGSIRIPASLCGIVGLKPTYGLVSRGGVFPVAWSMDHAGPLTKTVEDTALVLQAIAGWDPRDPASAKVRLPNYRRALGGDIRGLRVGVLEARVFQGADPDVLQAYDTAVETLEALGGSRVVVSLPHLDHALPAMRTINSGEAGAVHEKWLRTRPQDYGQDVRLMLELSRLVLASHYVQAQRVRRLLQADFQAVFQSADVLVLPTCPVPAPRLSEKRVTLGDRTVDLLAGLASYTCFFNLAGLPALSLPAGFSQAGLPIGLQIAGKPFDEPQVLRVGRAYEASTPWHRRRPPEA